MVDCPQWLAEAKLETNNTTVEDAHEEERQTSLTVSTNIVEEPSICHYRVLLKVISYCRRVLNLKLPNNQRFKLPTFITSEEINNTLLLCINQVQVHEFSEEMKQLRRRGEVPRKSKLRTLCPFFDEKRTLRMSGRIVQSDASYETRHPIIMPGKNNFTKLINVDFHHRTLHGGPQSMLNFLRTKYWTYMIRIVLRRSIENVSHV